MLLKSHSYSSLITKSWSSTILPEKRSIYKLYIYQ